jgi:hypothetical protein
MDDIDWSNPQYEVRNGIQMWRVGLYFHRMDGAAVIWPEGSYSWYQYGVRHREDGPAIDWMNEAESRIKEWYYRGNRILVKDQREYQQLMKMKVFW